MEGAGLSCDEALPFFILNRNIFGQGSTAKEFTFTYECKTCQALYDQQEFNDATSAGTPVSVCVRSIAVSLIQKTNLLLVVVKNSPECAFHETKSACLSCLGNVYQAYSPFVRMSKQTAYGASDKIYGRESKWKDSKKTGEHYSGETTDSSKEEPDKSKSQKPPISCRIGPRRRRPPLRKCVWFHSNGTEDDLKWCSGCVQYHLRTLVLIICSLISLQSYYNR